MPQYDVEIVTFLTTQIGRDIGAGRLAWLLSEGYVIVATTAANDNQPPASSGESTAIITVILQREQPK